MKNNAIKVLIVDDESYALDLMESLLKNHDYVTVVGKAMDRAQAMEQMINTQPDLIFQDIQMNDVNGIQMIEDYRKHHFTGKVVFVTAHSEYAIEAIKKEAYDYLLKPVDIEELKSLMLRFQSDRMKPEDPVIQKINKLKIPSRTGYSLVTIEDIVYCEADGNYTKIIMSTGEQITTSMNLGRVESDLPETMFFRLNRSVVINFSYLSAVNKGAKNCTIKSGMKEYVFQVSARMLKNLENTI